MGILLLSWGQRILPRELVKMSRILVTGGTGFIGQALIERLQRDGHQVVAVSRSKPRASTANVEWRQADLFSLKDIRLAMEGCDQAIYLVHSMLPSSSLMQGTFYDTDLILADNFARAALAEGMQHVLYLGGLVPHQEKLSWHLRSRLEVEQTLLKAAPQVTVLRAGMVIGKGGSSFVILRRLVERLPIMLLPHWTKTLTQPIDLRDLVAVIASSVAPDGPRGKIWDVGGPEPMTYRQMMESAARVMNQKPLMLGISVFSLNLSRLWLRLITQAPKSLIYPLIESLRYPMTVNQSRRFPSTDLMKTNLQESLTYWLEQGEGQVHSFSRPVTLTLSRQVRSVQRLPLPEGKNAIWVLDEYVRWLPKFLSFAVRTSLNENRCVFYFLHPKFELLVLEKAQNLSTPDRQLLYVVGGYLAVREQGRGRLEFREVLNGRYILAALHEFRPALPWIIYKWTQAVVHLFVMKCFGKHLRKLENRE